MGVVKVRDFAKECGCTPQNIYKHIRNYAADLEGHVHDTARGKVLDDFACNFIREAMYPRELDADSEHTKLAQEVAELRAALMKAGQENLRMASELVQAQGERDRALLELTQHQKLLKAAEDAEEARQAELASERQKAAEAATRAEPAATRAEEQARRAEAAEAKNEALRARGLLARMFRKGE